MKLKTSGRKILAALLSACMLGTVLPVGASAEDLSAGESGIALLAENSENTETDFAYDYDYNHDGINDSWNISHADNAEGEVVFAYVTPNSTGYTLHFGGKGKMKDWDTPKNEATGDWDISTSPWGMADSPYYSKITDLAFEDNSAITSIGKAALYHSPDFCIDVVLPDTITSIGDLAFVVLPIKSIHFSKNLEYIGSRAFERCSELTEVDLSDTKLSGMGGSSFNSCEKLSKVLLPETLTTIAYGTFKGCPALKSITLPNSVTEIGQDAFARSTYFGSGLESIALNNVTVVGTNAFSHCSALETVDFGKVQSIKYNAFGNTNLKEITIPETCTEISSLAFTNCKSLKTAIINADIAIATGDTPYSQFEGCESLETVYVNGKEFGRVSFKDCTSLKAVILGENLERFSVDRTFAGTSQIVQLYKSEDAIGKSTLSGLVKYNFKSNEALCTIGAITNGGTVSVSDDFEAGKLTEPTKAGYVFAGWYDNANLEGNPATTYEAGKTYYAKWADAWTLTFDTNGGSLPDGVKDSVDAEKGQSYTLPTPTRTGYTFNGWYNGEEKIEGASFAPTANTTLTAQWAANSYTIKFDANGGAGTMEDVTAFYDEEDRTLPANTFTNSGKVFLGWAVSSDGEVVYTDGATVKNLAESGEVTLYAVWGVPSTPITPATPVVRPSEPDYTPSTSVSKGWKDLKDGSVYYKNGVKVKGWQEIDGATYYFDQKGYLQTGWLKLDENWYRLDEKTGEMRTGWVKVGNAWYYMEKTGVMKSATWIQDGGKWYYLGADGAMYANKWRCTKGVWYYLLGNGEMAKNRWVEDKGNWYYFGSDGGMLVNTVTPDGYTVDENGVWKK